MFLPGGEPAPPSPVILSLHNFCEKHVRSFPGTGQEGSEAADSGFRAWSLCWGRLSFLPGHVGQARAGVLLECGSEQGEVLGVLRAVGVPSGVPQGPGESQLRCLSSGCLRCWLVLVEGRGWSGVPSNALSLGREGLSLFWVHWCRSS